LESGPDSIPKEGSTTTVASAVETMIFGMNTEITCKIYGDGATKAEACVTAELGRLEKKLSRSCPTGKSAC